MQAQPAQAATQIAQYKKGIHALVAASRRRIRVRVHVVQACVDSAAQDAYM